MIEWVAKLECPNPSCIAGKHLALPYPNQQRTGNSQPNWPIDAWQAFVACPHCGQGRLYSKSDVRWGMSQTFLPGIWESTSFRQVEVKCDRADCELPIRIHIQAEKPWRNDISRSLLHAVIGDPRCSSGHSVAMPVQYLGSRDLSDFGDATL